MDSIAGSLETGAAVIARALQDNGVEHVFMYPGGTIAPLLDELIKLGITYTCCRTEQGAGFAALAAAKVSGRPQVCMVTSGPGVTNAVTPVADAYYDSVPLILITGQVATNDINTARRIRQTGFQETDTIGIYQPVSKLTKRLGLEDPLAETVSEIFDVVQRGRQGPAVIEMPMNIQRSDYTLESRQILSFDHIEKECLPQEQPLRKNDLEQVVSLLRNAQRPLILAGNGLYLAGAVEEFRKFSENARIPVVSSLPGLGTLPVSDPNAYSFIGYSGEYYANLALYYADVVLCLGARLDLRQTGSELHTFSENKKIIRVDIDQRELDDGRVNGDISIHSDLANFFEKINSSIFLSASYTRWHEQILEWKTRFDSSQFYMDEDLSSYHVVKTVAEETKQQSLIVTSGVGTHQQLVARYFDFDFPSRRWLTSAGHGTMGYDLPAIIGAMKQTKSHDQGVCFVGDGSFQMNIQELAVIKEQNLPIKIFVLDNRRLGIVSQFQLQNWEEDHSTGNKYNPEFTAIAKAYGIPAFECSHKDQLKTVVSSAFAAEGPALIHCRINYNEDVKPMLLGGQNLDQMYPFKEVGVLSVKDDRYCQGL